MIFCFFKDRVFVTCMDDDCRRKLACVRAQYYTMGRVLEEDICSVAGGSNAASSSAAARCMYTLLSPTVRAVLSHEQVDVLEKAKAKVESIAHQCGGESRERFNIRDFCKVPWRNIFVSTRKAAHHSSSKDERTWVELSEPMLRSYVSSCLSSQGVLATRRSVKMCVL